MTTRMLATALALTLAAAPAAAQEPSRAPARPAAPPAEAASPAQPRSPAQPARPATAAKPAPARPAVAPAPEASAAPTQAPAPTAAPAPPPATGPGIRRRNVAIEVTISDQAGTSEPIKNVVSMIVADRHMGSVRSNGEVLVRDGMTASYRPVTLNVDAMPQINLEHDDSILLSLTIEYRPTADRTTDGGSSAQLNERISLTLESGKSLVVSRATDPGGNRKIVMEVTATLMK